MAVIVVDDADLETEGESPKVELAQMWCVRVASSPRAVPITRVPVPLPPRCAPNFPLSAENARKASAKTNVQLAKRRSAATAPAFKPGDIVLNPERSKSIAR